MVWGLTTPTWASWGKPTFPSPRSCAPIPGRTHPGLCPPSSHYPPTQMCVPPPRLRHAPTCHFRLSICGFLLLVPARRLFQRGPHARSSAFRIADIFFVRSCCLLSFDSPLPELHRATFVTSTFISQNNAVHGDSIGHGNSGQRHACTMRRILYRVAYLRAHGAPPPTHPFVLSRWGSSGAKSQAP